MASFKEILLSAVQDWDNSATRLRLKYLGSVLNKDKLKESGFKLEKSDDNEPAIWTKLIQKKSYRIALKMTPLGTLCGIQLAMFINLSFESIGAPYGWYKYDDISKRSEDIIAKSIGESVKIHFPAGFSKEWSWHLKNINYNPETGDRSKEKDFVLCCYANQYLRTDPEVAGILASSLIRHIKHINNRFILTDLAHICGRLKMIGESCIAIKKVVELDQEISAEGWTNIGAVLCDNLQQPAAAVQCFMRAIEIDKSLPQPRQNIWVAANKIMEQLLTEKKFVDSIKIFEEVSAIGDPSMANHGVYSYAGLSYESLGQNQMAEKCYNSALSIDSDCMISNEALERIKSKGRKGKFVSLSQRLQWIANCLEYSHLQEDVL